MRTEKKEKNTKLTTSKSRKAQTEPAVACATVTGGSVSSLSTNGDLLSGILSEFYTPSSMLNSPTVNTYVNELNKDMMVNESDMMKRATMI